MEVEKKFKKLNVGVEQNIRVEKKVQKFDGDRKKCRIKFQKLDGSMAWKKNRGQRIFLPPSNKIMCVWGRGNCSSDEKKYTDLL